MCRINTLLLKASFGLIRATAVKMTPVLVQLQMLHRLQQAVEMEPPPPVPDFKQAAHLVRTYIQQATLQVPKYSTASRTLAARIVLVDEQLRRTLAEMAQMIESATTCFQTLHCEHLAAEVRWQIIIERMWIDL